MTFCDKDAVKTRMVQIITFRIWTSIMVKKRKVENTISRGRSKKMSEKCYDLNPNCMAKAEGDAKRPCPAYEQKIGCWELDWKPVYVSLPEDQKKMMGEWMKDNCPKCPVNNLNLIGKLL